MKLSQLFTKTSRQVSHEETSINAQLLTRGGFIFKNKAGVYSMLPLGVRVIKKINRIVREEMNAIGGQELFLNTLQDTEIWKKSGRFNQPSVKEVMFGWKDEAGKDQMLGFTHEEVVAQIASLYVSSYKDLPKYVYQIQTKFRHEPRAQAGLLRGREFLMKDLYSLTIDIKQLEEFYERCAEAYLKIFDRVGLKAIRTEASGGIFSPRSDEFQVESEVGEDTIYVCSDCGKATNKEIIEEVHHQCAHCDSESLKETRSIEVGNIFKLGTAYSEAMGLFFTDEQGKRQPVVMGSYGIGIGRLMATVVEVHHDGRGIRWPESIAPYGAQLIAVTSQQSLVTSRAKKIYEELEKEGVEVLFDDREGVSAGEKFADADLIGCPVRLVVSEKTGEKVEVKKRVEEKTSLLSVKELVKSLT